jgi:penicillin-binding protein 2
MPFDAFRFKVFTRRVFIVSAVQTFCFLAIIGRLFKFQILDYNYFKNKSDGNRIKTSIIPPLRGIIKDRNNFIVASNTEYYRIILKKTNLRNDLKSIEALAKVLQFGDEGLHRLILEYNRNKLPKEIILYRYLTRKELLKVEFNLHLLKNISVGIGNARIYSNSLAFSSLLGYVVQVSSEESKTGKYVSHPDIKIGAEGLEKIYDKELLGKHGVKYTEVNVSGVTISNLETINPVAGKNIKISFNSILQSFAFEMCKTKKASVVLLDIKTGEVLVFLSTPTFDINLLSKKIDNETWKNLLQDPLKPLVNRPIQASYTTGSIHKIVTSLVALSEGMRASETILCKGQTVIYNTIRRCWFEKGHGKLDLKNAIKHSCNMMFYHVGTFAPMETFHKIAKELSIGETFPSFDFTKQNSGINPDDKWKRGHLKERWYQGDTINLSIGQGFVRANALQLAVMMARIASLGKKVEPTLKFWEGASPPEFQDIDINSYHIGFVKSALFDATNSPGGTSYGSRIIEKGLEFSGKTGTAQVVSKFLKKNQYNDTNRPHGLFSGFAPFENSRFAASVIVENGGFGSAAAAPIGKNLLLFAQLLELGRISDAKKLAFSLGLKIPELEKL